ncbi:MAG TPA: DNA-3-methyladenine glycosylase I [Magnetospirillaceae bacterium]|jgi:3-methyladenine DNA glycosylase Tag
MATKAKTTSTKSAARVPPFAKIMARAAERKGGEAKMKKLLPTKPKGAKVLAALGDDRVLADMAKRVFSAGFVWRVIEQKWPGFEAAFLKFDPKRLTFQPDEFWEKLLHDKRIVRNAQKIMSVRENASFVRDVASEHGSFGKFLAAWPTSDYVGLLDFLAKRGSRLGGNSGQYFLRFLGYDSFIVTQDVAACLRDSGVDLPDNPTSKRDLKKIQDRFNAWHEETGLPLAHLSRICAMSVGNNYDAATIRDAVTSGM